MVTNKPSVDESLELAESIINTVREPLIVLDHDLKVVSANRSFYEAFKVTPEETVGQLVYDLGNKQWDIPKLRELLEIILPQKTSFDNYEVEHNFTDIGRRIMLLNARQVQRVWGKARIILLSIEDVTERKRLEHLLIDSEERFRRLFETANDGILLLEKHEGKITHSNPAIMKMLGYPKDELIGSKLYDVGFPNQLGTIQEIMQTLEKDGIIHYKDVPLRKKTQEVVGTDIYMVDKASLVQCNIRDITERKQAEESLIRQQRSIKLSSRIANVFLTSSRSEVYANVLDVLLKTLESRFGYFGYIDEAGDLISPSLTRDVWDQCQVAEKNIVFSRADWGGLWGRSLMEKQTLVSNENLRIPEGHVALQNAIATPIVHHDNLIGQFVLANKAGGYDKDDLELLESAAAQTAPILFAIQEEARQKTAHEKLEEQIRQAQKMESVGRLAGGVAHDFNNMLGVILGHVEFALEKAEQAHELHADLKEIQTAAKRSADITKQLLAFARKQVISPKQLDLNDTVESMLNMLRRLIGEDIDLVWKPAAHLWSVKMDPSQIDQILANLCVNARDAISGVGKLTIETGRKTFEEEYCKQHAGFTPGDFVLLAVSDNGCGMDKDTLDNIFEPFFTTKDVGKGTGLGLATIYGICKQNNGFINVYSEPGQGSTFRIYLPRLVPDDNNDKAIPEKKAAAGGTETILLVEDEPSILRMTRMMLERKGYSVLSAATPAEAIEKAKNHSGAIDLLLTDVVMPEMNCRDLAGQITALYPDIRLLFMSGYTANVIAHQGVLDDGVAFIQKPFSMADMTAKVREVLDLASDIS